MTSIEIYRHDEDESIHAALLAMAGVDPSLSIRRPTLPFGPAVFGDQESENPRCHVVDADDSTNLLMLSERAADIESDVVVIFATRVPTFEIAQKAFRAGGADCVVKPVDINDFQRSISRAIGYLRSQLVIRLPNSEKHQSLKRLTPRETEVFEKMLVGWSIKMLSNHFGVSVQTAAKHRARILSKLCVENEVELVNTYSSDWAKVQRLAA